MSFLGGLKVFGQDVVKAFAWFGSPKGQSVVAAGEVAVESFVPGSAPIVALFNGWAARAYNIEAIAVAAGKASGTGPEKAVAVTTAVIPDVLTYGQQAGLPARTAAQIKIANDAVVAFIKAMTEPDTAESTTPAADLPVPPLHAAALTAAAPVD